MKQFTAKFILIHPHLLEEAGPGSIVRCCRPVCSFRSCTNEQEARVEDLRSTKLSLRKPRPQAASECTHGSQRPAGAAAPSTGEKPEGREGRGLPSESQEPGRCLLHDSLDSDQPAHSAPSPLPNSLSSALSGKSELFEDMI